MNTYKSSRWRTFSPQHQVESTHLHHGFVSAEGESGDLTHPSFTAIKTGSTVFQLVLTYVVWILCVLAIQGNEVIFHNYPPAVVALMVCGILQMLFILAQIVWGKKKYFSARNILLATIFFLCFTIGAVVPTTVLRHRSQ